MSRILVVDEAEAIQPPLAEHLRRSGLQADVAAGARGMRRCMAERAFDLVVLDVSRHPENGLRLCRELRQRHGLPVMLLANQATPAQRTAGLEAGACDYLVRPFEPRELALRIGNLLAVPRIAGATRGNPRYAFGPWRLDTRQHQLTRACGQPMPLSTSQLRLLTVLLQRPHQVLSRDTLVALTRDHDTDVFDRSVDTQVSRLRRKLEADPRQPVMLKTVRGNGYVFTADVHVLPPAAHPSFHTDPTACP